MKKVIAPVLISLCSFGPLMASETVRDYLVSQGTPDSTPYLPGCFPPISEGTTEYIVKYIPFENEGRVLGLINALEPCRKTLTSLLLRSNKFNDDLIIMLSKALSPTLTSLEISASDIGFTGEMQAVEALADYLNRNRVLKNLSLATNPICKSQMDVLIPSMPHTLEELNISYNFALVKKVDILDVVGKLPIGLKRLIISISLPDSFDDIVAKAKILRPNLIISNLF